MKKYLLSLLVLHCFGFSLKSQSVTTTYENPEPGVMGNAINITLPTTGYPPYLPSGSWYSYNSVTGGREANPRTSIFLEYPDGGFTTFESSFHTFKTTVLQPSLQPALLTIRGKYDPIKPHGRITVHPITVTATNTSSGQQILSAGKNIALTSDVVDLIADDTIQTVITFKKNFSGAGKILFYYNYGMQAFTVINSNNNKIQPCNVPPGTQLLNSVRSYQVPITTNFTDITPALVNSNSTYSLSTASSNLAFKYFNTNMLNNAVANVLVFDVPSTVDNAEHNLFVTLVTQGNNIYREELASTTISAFLFSDSMYISTDQQIRKQQLLAQSANLGFPIAQPDPNSTNPNAPRPHDPNYIIADKRCTNICNTTLNGQKFNFKVHFQNDGAGFAKVIVVTIYLHKKFKVSTFQKISANVAGKDIVGSNFAVSIPPSLPLNSDWYPVVCTLKTNLTSDGTVNLFGTKMASYPETDIRTMGDVLFSIDSEPLSVPSYFSIASIVFDEESPVVTRMNRIRCCEKMGVKKDTIPDRPFGKKGKNIDRGNLRYFDNKKADIKIKKDG